MKPAKPSGRGLRPGQLSRRYRRIRNSMPSRDESDDPGLTPLREAWLTQDPWCREYRHEERDLETALIATYHALLAHGTTVEEQTVDIDWIRISVAAPGRPTFYPTALPRKNLVPVLHQVICQGSGWRLVSLIEDLPLQLGSEAAKSNLTPFRWIAEQVHPFAQEFTGYMSGLFLALTLSSFWVRSPAGFTRKSDDVSETIGDLMEHIFAVHPVPKCLRNAWTWPLNDPALRWIVWFILAGQGASIPRAGKLFRWQVSTKVLHFLHLAPQHLGPEAAYTWAEVKTLGGSGIEFRRLLANPAYRTSPGLTEDPRDFSFRRFWTETVYWLIQHRDVLTDEICESILPWAWYEYRETAGRDVIFSWKGRSPVRVIRAAQEYAASLWMPYGDLCWAPRGWDREWTTQSGLAWRISELVSGRQLYDEGQAMSNCVAQYTERCASGQSTIFSLRCEGLRRLTVEVDPESRVVVQARGPFNRFPIAEESTRLQEWQQVLLAL